MSEIKPISGADDRIMLRDALPLDTPFTLNIFPTNLCNFRCYYCAQSKGASSLKEKYHVVPDAMTMDTLRKLVDDCKKFDNKFKLVSFMGHGEPLLNKELPDMVAYVTKANIAKRTEIITNASLLTHDLSDHLISAGLTNLRISLQGLSSQKYKEISNVNIDFDQFVDQIRYFYTHKGKSNVFVKIMDVSLNDLQEKEFYNIFDTISDRMYIESVKPVYDNIAYEENVSNVLVDRYGNRHAPRKICPLAFFSLAVWPNGDVAPCDAIYHPIHLGNIKEDDILDMWNSKKLLDFRIELLHKKKHLMKGCMNCCAPDDVSHEKDTLDGFEEELLSRLKGR